MTDNIAQRAHLRELVEASRQIDAAIDEYVVNLLDSGWTYAMVAEELGYTRQRVHQLYGPERV